MIAQDFLKEAVKTLEQAGVPSARLDCLILLEDTLGMDRAAILAHPETRINAAKLAKLNKQIVQRSRHVPLAYIRGKVHFFGREFAVNEHVLVPRPETETMIEILKKLPLPGRATIADIGTGSGCIGITAALELPGTKAELYDIDPEALKVAAQNIKAHRVNASCHQNDLLEAKPATDIIVANLPYVPERYVINQAAEHEPKHAIFAGKDGLNLYRKFWQQVHSLPKRPIFILTESLPTQHNDLADIASAADYKLEETQDFIQVFKPV